MSFKDDLKNFRSQGSTQRATPGFDWAPQCEAIGCKLKPSAYRDGRHLCRFHHGSEMGEGGRYWWAINKAIDENMDLIRWIARVQAGDPDVWSKKNRFVYMQWPHLPMIQDEPPSVWLSRLQTFINERIQERATEMIETGEI